MRRALPSPQMMALPSRSQYQNRPLLPDFTEAPCPDTPRGLEQIKRNLYRHTAGGGLAVVFQEVVHLV